MMFYDIQARCYFSSTCYAYGRPVRPFAERAGGPFPEEETARGGSVRDRSGRNGQATNGFIK